MAFELFITRKIKAPQEFVFDWWTDLSSEDSKLVKPLKARQIISKNTDTILLRDEEEMYFRKMTFNVRVTLERPNRWVSEYDGKEARAKSEYVLNSDGYATTLNYRTRIEPKGFFTNVLSPFVKPLVKRIFSEEMKVFVRELEKEYQAKGPK